MANSANTTLSFSNLADTNLLRLPYEQLDQLLQGQQQQIDLVNTTSQLSPVFRQDSVSDRELAGRINKYQQDVRNQLAEIAAKGDSKNYIQALSEVQRNIQDIYKPGGAADVLRQRKLQAEAEDKRLDEFYKDNPTWADYYKKNRQYNEVGYNPATGEYKPLSSLGQTTKYVDAKEFDEFANRNLDNIKDSLMQEGVSKKQLDAITSVYDFYKIKGVSEERIANALLKVMPQEYIDSEYMKHKIDQFYNPNIGELDTRLTVDGKLNEKNPIAQKIKGYAEIGARVDKESQRITDNNEIDLEKFKSSLRRQEEKEKSGIFRFEGQSIGFNPSILPQNNQDLEKAKTSTQQILTKLKDEINTTTDPQRREFIAGQIKWNEAILEKQQNLQTRAFQEAKPEGYDDFMKTYGFDRMPVEDKIAIEASLVTRDAGTAADVLSKYMGRRPSQKEVYSINQQYKEYKGSKDDMVNDWLKSNSKDTNFQLETISLDPNEANTLKASLNTNAWTFFDENGMISNEETGAIFGTKDKPIISDNVKIGGITKHPFGDFGNLVTITDKEGKVYYGAMNNGNIGKAVGNNIKNKAPEGSDQWILGESLSDPATAHIISQMSDMNMGDKRPIVSGTNTLGRVEKTQTASGTLYKLYAPEGVIFDTSGSTTKEFNNITNLTQALQIIENSYGTQTN